MISDNLAPLFDDGQPSARIRQGTILTWDPANGNNTVDLAGGVLTNVGILNTGEAIALKAGHVVGLLGQGSTWFILGRVTMPGDPQFASASVAFASDSAFTSNFTVPNALATRASVSLPVPSWADEAAVIATATASVLNRTAVDDYCFLTTLIDGFGGIASGSTFNKVSEWQSFQNLTANYSDVVTSPGATISVVAQLGTNNGTSWVADTGNRCALSAIAIFRSTT